MSHKLKVKELRNELITSIQKEYTFITDNAPLEFKRPFMIWLTEVDSKVGYVVHGMEGKDQLLVKSETNETEVSFHLRLDEIEDLVELANILDELESDMVKILAD